MTLADFCLGRLYTDYFKNPQAACKERFAALLEKYPEYEGFGIIFSAEMQDYLKKRPKSAY